jgi:hypothetical protein
MRKRAMNYVSQVTELSTEKVELNLVNDAKRHIKLLDAIFEYKQEKDKPIAAGIQKLESLQKEVTNAKSDIRTFIVVEKAIPKFESELKEAEVTLNFLTQAAKELGVKPESIKEFDDLSSSVFIAKKDIKYLKRVVELAKKTLKEF